MGIGYAISDAGVGCVCEREERVIEREFFLCSKNRKRICGNLPVYIRYYFWRVNNLTIMSHRNV